MRILADENVDRPIVSWLREQGHDVVEAAVVAQKKKVTATKNRQAGKESRLDYPDLVAGTVFFRKSAAVLDRTVNGAEARADFRG